MAKVTIVAKLTTTEDKVAEFEEVLATMVQAAEEEAGLEIYSAHRDPNQVGVYWFFELYTAGDDLAVHGKGDGMRAAMGALGGLLAGAPEVSILEPVVAKGLEL